MNAAVQNRLYEGALLAEAAYKRTPFHPASNVRFLEDEDTGTQALLIHSGPEGLYIGFAGTQWEDEQGGLDLRDLRTDISFSGRVWDRVLPGTVHGGFLRAYLSVRDLVLAEVRSALEGNKGNRPYPIFVDGHSLGGALAQLCAFDLTDMYRQVANVTSVVLGCPALFSRKAQTVYNWRMFGSSWAVINNSDLVPRVALAAGWRRAGSEVYIDMGGRIRHRASSLFRAFDRLAGRLFDAKDGVPDSLADHRIQEYLRHLDPRRSA